MNKKYQFFTEFNWNRCTNWRQSGDRIL